MKKILIVLLIGVISLSLVSCTNNSESRINSLLGFKVGSEEIVDEKENYGFHNDGLNYIKYDLSSKEIDFMSYEGWHEMPLSESLYDLVYGYSSASKEYHPTLTFDGSLLVPTDISGYYFFYDRYEGCEDPYSDSELLNRSAFNFSIAIYDEAEKALYFIEYDT